MNAKRFLIPGSLFIAALSLSTLADDIAVYKGTGNSFVIGQGETNKSQSGQYLIIDFTTSHYTAIFLSKVGKQKEFSVGTPLAFTQIVPIDDRKSTPKQYTVFVAARTTPNIPLGGGNSTSTEYDYLFFRGLSVTVTIGSVQKTLPVVFTGILNTALSEGTITSGPNVGGIIPATDSETHGVWSLQKSLTSEVEANNGSLDAAVQSVKTFLISQHYTEAN